MIAVTVLNTQTKSLLAGVPYFAALDDEGLQGIAVADIKLWCYYSKDRHQRM